ncbi:MAG: TatD family hydrolase [Bacteroidales bacterium]|nr:TatD family hydrolase [Bacteroidales bacterium]
MVLIDSHSHIYSEEFDSDRGEVLARASEAGVKYHILPNVDSTTTSRLLDTSLVYPHCYPLMGVHPTSVTSDFERELLHVEDQLRSRKFYGVGEVGIDLYWDKTFIEEQKEAFAHQVRLAKQYQIPLVIHSRNSIEAIFEILDKEIDSSLSGVFHCFSGSIEHYSHIREYKSFKVGIGGVVTYKNGGLDSVLPHVDIADILLETDLPYLSPVPVRGKRNESYNLIYIALKIADILGISVQDVARQTFQNTQSLFKLPIQ